MPELGDIIDLIRRRRDVSPADEVVDLGGGD